MGRYAPEGTHLNELLGTRGSVDPAECTYCKRACSKGVTRCPQCEWDFGPDPEKPVFPEKRRGVEMED